MYGGPKEIDVQECLSEVNNTISLFEGELAEIQKQGETFGMSGGMKSNEEGFITFITESIKSLENDKSEITSLIKRLRVVRKKAIKNRKSRKKVR